MWVYAPPPWLQDKWCNLATLLQTLIWCEENTVNTKSYFPACMFKEYSTESWESIYKVTLADHLLHRIFLSQFCYYVGTVHIVPYTFSYIKKENPKNPKNPPFHILYTQIIWLNQHAIHIQCLGVKVTTVEDLTCPHHLYLIKNKVQAIALLWSYKNMCNYFWVRESTVIVFKSFP